MSEKKAFEDDDIYDFDYLKEDSLEPCRPKLKPRETRAVNDNRVKLPPVLVGRNVAAMNEAKRLQAVKRSMTKSAVSSNNPEIDWHKERLKLKGPRQPLKEDVAQKLGVDEPWRKAKLPQINEPTKMMGHLDTKPKPYQLSANLNSDIGKEKVTELSFSDQIQQLLEIEPKPPSYKPKIDGTSYSKTRRQLVYKNERVGFHGQNAEQLIRKTDLKSIQQSLVSTKSPNTSAQIKEFTLCERRPRVRFAVNTELNQDVSVHKESKPFYRPRPNTPVEIDYDEEVRQATALSRELEELHRELQNKDPKIDDGVDSFDDILSTPPLGLRSTTAAFVDTADGIGAREHNILVESQFRKVPELNWNGENARRGAGFVSKLKKQPESKSSTGVNMQLPEKIRKQMKKYFN